MESGDLTQVTEGLKGLKKETTKVGQNTSNLYKELKKTSESQVSEIKKLGEKVQKMGNKHIVIDPKSLKGIGDQFGKAIETKKSVFDNSKQIGKAFEKAAGGKKGSRDRELAEETARQGRKDFAESQKNREETNSILSKLLKNSNRSLKESLKDKAKDTFGGGIIGDIVGELIGNLLARGALGKIFKKGMKFLKKPMRNMKAAKLKKQRNLSRKGLKRTKSGRIDLRQKGAKSIIKSGGKSAAKGAAKGALKGAAKVGLKVLGPVAAAAGVAMDAMDIANAEVGKKGGAIGKAAGGAIGGAIGLALGGPVGAMIGQQVGSWVGGAIGEQFDDVDSNKAGERLAAEIEDQKEEYNENMEELRKKVEANNKKLAEQKEVVNANKQKMVEYYDRLIAQEKDPIKLKKLEEDRKKAIEHQDAIIAGYEATNEAANAALKADMDKLTAQYNGDMKKAAAAKAVLDEIRAQEEAQKKAAEDRKAAEEALEFARMQKEIAQAKYDNAKTEEEKKIYEAQLKGFEETMKINEKMVEEATARGEEAKTKMEQIKAENAEHQHLWATGWEHIGNKVSGWWNNLWGLNKEAEKTIDKNPPPKPKTSGAQPVASGGFIPKAASGRGIYEVNEQGMESFTGQDGKTYLINPNKGTINNANRTKQLLDGSQKASMQQGGGGAPSIIPMPTPPQKDDSKKSEKKQQNVTNYIDSYTLKAAIGRSAVMV